MAKRKKNPKIDFITAKVKDAAPHDFSDLVWRVEEWVEDEWILQSIHLHRSDAVNAAQARADHTFAKLRVFHV